MATYPPRSGAPIPFKVIEEQEDHPSQPRLEDYDDFISTLPFEKGSVPSRKYQGFWYPEGFLPGAMAIQQRFKARPDDLFLVSFPKSGTTWLKALVFATMTRKQYPLARHPLLSLNPHDCVAYIEERFAIGQASKVEALPSPRILSTHMPYSLLQDSVAGSGCRIIYIARDPKDALVSFWHFTQKSSPKLNKIPFTEAFEAFCEGKFPFGPIWDHLLGWWRESLKRPEKVLFLKYEGLLEEPVANVKRLAEFVGCPFSEEEEEGGMVEEIVRLCSMESMKSLEVNKVRKHGPIYQFANSSFFRKGVKGDWRNHMSPEMARRLDVIIEEKLQGSGLTGWSSQA
ncbi:flavonol 3-sulfotransferase-like [Phoenix dactylifera]|uniref:Sulfotransferase n=1 Tax=Phoenix dactylifera TaxID=42345 RepID=A0A8B9ACL9_PHODC|nr:flavonol 3-sulfotransferase-like [Phoenix dactylifera]XP_038983497.1 flavonol 3-sulfotransferase-like [Phoenix dactylifera]